MKIRTGYDISYSCPDWAPLILMLMVHPSREKDLLSSQNMRFNQPISTWDYRDMFGNHCTRIHAPPGELKISADFEVQDSGLPDEINWDAVQHPVPELPDETLIYLLGSRYCDTDRLSDTAWSLFGHTRPGWERVQAIVDYVHNHITFGYQFARPTRTAWDGYQERVGVCRDYAHLAVTFCRCMNIPARYCTGYLGDIGIPPVDAPMDFSAWFEVYLSGRWWTFDARHNTPRIGRILMATGRDATDVAMVTSFGPATLSGFHVHTDEVKE
ncbi:transglutaminase family protein [Roseomonas sp. NAR14]|uniref:Transglutaminase family protein n=1 Tax=Roseomonas acroporae TaxID=2937791 RepID=A0A9X1Y7N4_9PROT|nr:transglutaminase family protein [Roseomonas acroporae]MCK8784658.1 transglutaminase family protein [Roseomonas acroporae]